MTGAYDDLSQEMWGRADTDMPQEYLTGILAQIMPKRREPQTDSDLDGGDKLKAIYGRLQGRQMARPWIDVNKVDTKLERGKKVSFKIIRREKIDGRMRTLWIVKSVNVLEQRNT